MEAGGSVTAVWAAGHCRSWCVCVEPEQQSGLRRPSKEVAETQLGITEDAWLGYVVYNRLNGELPRNK